tara:strand:- start:588 stop:794 length:207 start_codon:yes stop_codon:yes gene_type:complete
MNSPNLNRHFASRYRSNPQRHAQADAGANPAQLGHVRLTGADAFGECHLREGFVVKELGECFHVRSYA